MLSLIITDRYENEILELIDNQDKFTRGDLQGMVTVLVNKIMEDGYKIIDELKKTK